MLAMRAGSKETEVQKEDSKQVWMKLTVKNTVKLTIENLRRGQSAGRR